MEFKVETTELGQLTFVVDEQRRVRIELNDPANFQHAFRVANYLSENVKEVVVAGSDLEVTSLGSS
jgi:peroxiredoxin